MAQETSKASERRHADKEKDWNQIFVGNILDVGPGDDPLVWTGILPYTPTVTPFDKEQGDANKIDEYFHWDSFDCVHGSQVMEHLYNPGDFINRCLRILKPGGWIVMTIPCVDHYERCIMPSRFNPDHKHTFSLWRKQAPTKFPHIYVPEWIKQFDVSERRATLINTNFDYLAPESKDQTWIRAEGVEAFIEILLRKHG